MKSKEFSEPKRVEPMTFQNTRIPVFCMVMGSNPIMGSENSFYLFMSISTLEHFSVI